MKRTTSPFYAQRTFIFCLQSFLPHGRSSRSLRSFNASVLSLLMLIVPIAPLAAAPSRVSPKEASLVTTSSTSEQPSESTTTQPASHADDQPLVPEVVSVTASLTDDIGLAAKKNPGDTITYTAVISTGGVSPGDDATGVVFTSILDGNTTLVGGSLNAQPIARADAYTASGNIPISLAAPGVLTNDIDPMTGTNAGLTVTEVQGAAGNVGVATDTTATGAGLVKGSVTLSSGGNFTYEPPPGFIGNDTFTYKTSEGTLSDTNTVTITISNMAWFIRNTGGGSNRGTFSNPFTSIASFNTANAAADAAPNPKSGDFISLRSGTYSEADGINLRNSQKLIGEAIQFNTVFTADANSSTAYTTFAGGTNTAPTIAASAGNGVDLADSNMVRGLNVANTSGFDINGGAVGSPIINTVNLTGTGGAVNISTSGTFGANVSFGTLESISSTGANINLVSVTGALGITAGGAGLTGSAAASSAISINGGSVGFTYPANVSKTSGTGSLLNVSNAHSGTLIFNTGTLNATSGNGLQFDNADGTYTFNGTTTLGGGDAGVDILNGSAGTFAFGGTSITNPTGVAFNVDGTAAAITGGISISGPISKNNDGKLIDFFNYDTGTATLSGSLSCTSTCDGVEVTNNGTAGTVNFSGGTKTLNTAASIAVNLDANTGGSVNFTGGGLNLDTTSGTSLSATGGGSLTVSGSNNSVASTTGRAINVDGVTLNATLLDVSVTGGGTTTGVFLKNTGAGGQFVVTGTGTTVGSGGTIANITGDDVGSVGGAATTGTGIYMENVSNVSLSNMIFGSSAIGQNLISNFGIRGESVNNFTLTDSEFRGTFGNTTSMDEDTIRFGSGTGTTGLTGTAVFQGNDIQGALENNLSAYVYGSNTLNLTIKDTAGGDQAVFGGNSTVSGGHGFSMESGGTSNVTLNVNGVAFNGANGTLLNVTSIGSATQNLQLTNNTFHNGQATTLSGGVGVNITGNLTNSNITYNIDGNSFRGTQSSSIFSMFNGASGTVNGIINNNTFGNNNLVVDNLQANYGSLAGGAFLGGIDSKSAGTGVINYALRISDNIIRDSGSDGVLMFRSATQNNQGTARVEVTITNNNIDQARPGVAGGVYLQPAGSGNPGDSGKIGINMVGNSIDVDDATSADAVFVDNGSSLTGHVYFPGYAGPGSPFMELSTFLKAAPRNNTWPAGSQDSGTGGANYSPGGLLNGQAFILSVPLLLAAGGVESDVSSFDTFINSMSHRALTQPELDSTVNAAMDRWSASGLTPKQISAMREIRFELGELKGAHLGHANGNRIVVDRNAQGKGWFVDPTPMDDHEFRDRTSGTRSYTNPFSLAAGRIDLLTVIEHEIGHELGLADSYVEQDRDSIMYGYLTAGERRLPARGQAIGARSGALKGPHFLSLSAKNDTVKRPSIKRASIADQKPLIPESGETVTVNGGSPAGFTLPGGDSVTITFQATVNTPPGARSVSTQGKVSGTNFALVNGITTASPNTNDPETGAVNDPTVTNINTTSTWVGLTSSDWNNALNWNPNTYAPGVTNPAINDVVIPNVGNQPNISATDIGIYSLNISNGRTLTITSPRVLTIGGSPGGDLTLDGIISGGNLNLGTGTHVINNAGGTGSLSSTNVATVLSGSTVTLNNNLQAGALAVNTGGSMNITNRTLSLNGSGAALTVPGGATFTTANSTVVFNGTAAQQAAGITYNNLTINNTIGTNVTGVTLTGNATVNFALALTSSDLATGAFTLTQNQFGTSSGVSDVVGTVIRDGGGIGLPSGNPLTFGNPNNLITFTGPAPNNATVVLTKAAPATYAAAVQRNYVISHAGGPGFFTATLRLRYLDPGELNGNTEALLHLRRLRTGDGHWVAQVPDAVNAANNYVESATVAAADLATQWTFDDLDPTASEGSVTGRILDNNGEPRRRRGGPVEWRSKPQVHHGCERLLPLR